MSNINGKAYAMNVATPMKPWKTIISSLVFRFLSRPSSGEQLKRLTFIHFARWVIVKRNQFPNLGGSQPPEKLNYDYLLFFSNFNGTWNQYIDAFSDAIPTGLDIIWRWSVKYPRAIPISPFKRYIAHNQYYTDYYYDAYPGASTTDVKAAVRLQSEVEAFAKKAVDMTADQFGSEYLALLSRVDGDLGSTGQAPVGT